MKIGKKRYPTLSLINSEQRHLQHPETWDHSDRDDTAQLQVGDFTKIGIEGYSPSLSFAPRHEGLGGERFWVRITKVLGQGRFVGAVDNDLIVYDLPPRIEIEFGLEHILSFEKKPIGQIV